MQLRVAEEYVRQFGNLAKKSNTLIVPANLSDIAGMIAMATRVFDQTHRDGSGQPPPGLFPDDAAGRRRADRLPRPDRVLGRRDHLPPARLLGAHRPGRADDPLGVGLGQPAALLVQGHPRPQGRQAAARHRRLAAEHPHRRRPPARARRRRPGRHHAALRRRHGLRVPLLRRGRRPAARRPGRVRHRRQRRVARAGRIAGDTCPASAPNRGSVRQATARKTNSPSAARSGWTAVRARSKSRREPHPVRGLRCTSRSRAWLKLEARRHRAGEFRIRSGRRRSSTSPSISQASGTVRMFGASGKWSAALR